MDDKDKSSVAVALACAPDACPAVTARGEEDLAEEIIACAREHGIPVLQDMSLCNQLARIPLGERIPVDVYFAIAGMLGYVFEIEEKLTLAEKLRNT